MKSNQKNYRSPGLWTLLGMIVSLAGLLLLGACSERVDDPDIKAHPAAWSEADSEAFHGNYVLEREVAFCQECHGEALKGDSGSPSCYECHDGPGGHPVGWVDVDQHGAEVAANEADACQSCHGPDYQGGWSAVSCYRCHDGPGGHPVGWNAGNRHGSEVRENGSESCAVCHGADYLGGWSGVSCYQCHNGGPNGPHPEGWVDPAQHGGEVRQNGPESCAACHGPDYTGGTSGVSCFTCHEGPGGHLSGWNQPANHGAEALANGIEACADCHGANYSGGWTGVSCYDCHNGPNP